MTDDSSALRRSVGFFGLVLYGLGTTIGAGIYALLGVVAGRAGLAAPASFLVASAVAAFTALCLGELSARHPRAGGEAVYVHEGFGSSALAGAVGWMMVVAGTVSAATVSLGFVGHLDLWLEVPPVLAIVLSVGVIGLVAAWGIRETVWLAGSMTLVEVVGLLLVVGAGGDALAEDVARIPRAIFGSAGSWNGIFAGGVIAFYAFLGFEDMINVAEEVRDVRRVLPRAILATLAISTLLYAVLAAVSVSVVPPEELAESGAPLVLVFERAGGSPAILGWIGLLAMLNGALVQIVKSSRVMYGLAGISAAPRMLGVVDARTQTPLRATGVAVTAVAVLASAFAIETLATVTSMATLLSFAFADFALVRLQRAGPAPADTFRVPGWVPWVGGCASLALLAGELIRRWG